MSHLSVRLAFQQRLAGWATDKGLLVAYEGVAFEPDPDDTYLRAFILPASTQTLTLEGVDRVYTGIFQVSVIAPSGSGTADAEGIVGDLDSLFPTFLRIQRDDLEIMVLTPIEQGPVIVDDNAMTVPASFQYRADRD
jgi:hypothetical protein